MTAHTIQTSHAPRFIRKTTLASDESNTNFVMLDNDIIEAVSSAAADKVTPLMSKIYLRLKTAPPHLWERQGVLRFEGETREGKWVKAWDQLCKQLRVSSETANKALQWMHEQGIIGYSAFKNGVGIRIFLNRAASSVAVRGQSGSKKILRFAPASTAERPASEGEPAFKDTFGVEDDLDSNLVPNAPKNGADTKPVGKTSPESAPCPPSQSPTDAEQGRGESKRPELPPTSVVSVDEIVSRLRSELEPCLKTAAAEAATQAAAREHHRTREWFETKALPKAVRVAQSESYNLFRKYGTLNDKTQQARAELEVGRASESITTPPARPQSEKEIMELAETCVAMLEMQGKSVDVTLAEISSEAGGWLLPEDAPKVREAAERLLGQRSERR